MGQWEGAHAGKGNSGDRRGPPHRERVRARVGALASWADWAEKPRERGFGLLWLFFLNLNF
jgi:hypothetical protein